MDFKLMPFQKYDILLLANILFSDMCVIAPILVNIFYLYHSETGS
jgi:hypothetical protein